MLGFSLHTLLGVDKVKTRIWSLSVLRLLHEENLGTLFQCLYSIAACGWWELCKELALEFFQCMWWASCSQKSFCLNRGDTLSVRCLLSSEIQSKPSVWNIKFFLIFMPGKSLKWGSFGNSGHTLGSCLVPGPPHSLNIYTPDHTHHFQVPKRRNSLTRGCAWHCFFGDSVLPTSWQLLFAF
jgi:hypothetical protein